MAPRRSPVYTLGVAGFAAVSWVVSGLRPFTVPEDAAVAAAGAIGVGLAWRSHRRQSGDPPTVTRREALPWIGLAAALAAWELYSFTSSPRHDHPTMSSIANNLMSSHPGRAAAFALWLLFGWALFARQPGSARPGVDRETGARR